MSAPCRRSNLLRHRDGQGAAAPKPPLPFGHNDGPPLDDEEPADGGWRDWC